MITLVQFLSFDVCPGYNQYLRGPNTIMPSPKLGSYLYESLAWPDDNRTDTSNLLISFDWQTKVTIDLFKTNQIQVEIVLLN